MGAPQRVGLYGSAFDPPHRAHGSLVQQALQQLELDVLHVVPTGQAWHKDRALSPAHHRLAMAQLAFAQEPRVVVDDCELHRPGPSYTIDTLHALRQTYGAQAELFLLMGQDQWERFGQWRAAEQIARFATICVAPRPDSTRAKAHFSFQGHSAQVLHLPPMDTSSTQLRQACAQGLALGALVLPAVARYIAEHHLYQTP